MSVEHNKSVLEAAKTVFGDTPSRERYFDLYAPDAILHGYLGVESGIDSIRQFYRAFWVALPDAGLSWEPPFGEGDFVAVAFEVTASQLGALPAPA